MGTDRGAQGVESLAGDPGWKRIHPDAVHIRRAQGVESLAGDPGAAKPLRRRAG